MLQPLWLIEVQPLENGMEFPPFYVRAGSEDDAETLAFEILAHCEYNLIVTAQRVGMSGRV